MDGFSRGVEAQAGWEMAQSATGHTQGVRSRCTLLCMDKIGAISYKNDLTGNAEILCLYRGELGLIGLAPLQIRTRPVRGPTAQDVA